jgi:hypothetical protein
LKSFLQYFAVLIALFGPKYGFFDSRMLLIPLLLYFNKINRLVLTRDYYALVAICFILILYSSLQFALFPPNPEFLRYIRAFISLICLPFIFNTNCESAIKVVINVLILHPIAIFVSMYSPSIQSLLAVVFQFVSETRNIRFNGLTAGFDIAGYLSISGFLLTIVYYLSNPKISYLIKSAIFYISAFFTSRGSIIIILTITLVIFFQYLLSSKLTLKKLLIVSSFLSIISVLVFKYVLPNIISTVELEFLKNYSDLGNEEAVTTYARTDPYEMLKSFIILPKTNLGLFFGQNSAVFSDSGYIKTINTIGILGLFISVFFYIRLYQSLKIIQRNSFFLKNISRSLKIIILITLILTIKNQYLFTRGSFELLIMIYFASKLPVKGNA